jgi:hypothetical protein
MIPGRYSALSPASSFPSIRSRASLPMRRILLTRVDRAAHLLPFTSRHTGHSAAHAGLSALRPASRQRRAVSRAAAISRSILVLIGKDG